MDGLSLVVDVLILAGAVILHEVGHGVVAYRCGDPTAAERGRLTLNPLRHIDPIGTVIVPGLLLASSWMVGAQPMLFGWAKPVPVNPRRMRHPRRDMALVAIAGPAVNLVLAALGALLLHQCALTPGPWGHLYRITAAGTIAINCVLAVLNLMPILPLDGGRILAAMLPPGLAVSYARMERWGLLIVLLLLNQTSVLTTLVRPVIRAFLWLGYLGHARVAS
jgi:Zn-dependent protease